MCLVFFFSSRRRHTRCSRDWSSDVCSSDLTSVFRATHRSAASLCGTVTFPAPPTAARAASTVVSSGADVRSATYTASRPRTRIAAFCIEGESEWATGSPITASRRVLALTSTRELFDDALHRRLQERLELDAGVAIHVEVAAEGVAHLGLVPLTAGDRKSTRLNSSHGYISYAVFCLKKKKNNKHIYT